MESCTMCEALPLMIGFLGSLHCLGMCGPLVLAYGLSQNRSAPPLPWYSIFLSRSGLPRHAAFHLGRLVTYGLLGAVAAGLFQAAELSRIFSNIHEGMMLVSGFLLMILGVVLLKVLPIPSFFMNLFTLPVSFLSRWMPPLLHSRSLMAGLALGMVAGYLPCCLSWAMVLTAASTRSPLQGFLVMMSFGIGTVPALLAAGLSGTFLSMKVRFAGERMAAVSILGMGVVLVFKGVGILA